MTSCLYCSAPIDPKSRFSYQRITGFEVRGEGESRRGGSDIILRERKNEWACYDCVTRVKRGVAPEQQSLGAA